MKLDLSVFSFVIIVSYVQRNLFLSPKLKDILLKFTLSSFVVVSLMFRSLIHFKFIVLDAMKYGERIYTCSHSSTIC